MKKTQKQKSFKIVLEFETKEDAEQWSVFYSEQGEQDCGYFMDHKKSIWRGNVPEYKFILRGYDRCPECKSPNVQPLQEFLDRWGQFEAASKIKKMKSKTETHICEDCHHQCNMEIA